MKPGLSSGLDDDDSSLLSELPHWDISGVRAHSTACRRNTLPGSSAALMLFRHASKTAEKARGDETSAEGDTHEATRAARLACVRYLHRLHGPAW